jgi:hypothetical protein
MIHLVSNIYDTAEWSRDFFEVTVIALTKKLKATKCSDHCSQQYGMLAKVARVLRRIERKIEDVLGGNWFEFRRGKGRRCAVRVQNIRMNFERG